MNVNKVKRIYNVQTDKELAALFNVSPVAIHHWKNRGVPKLRQQIIIATKLKGVASDE
jgi:uncharacterized protein YjcR